MENKVEITKSIFNMFKTMRFGKGIDNMEYIKPSPYEERVAISFNNGDVVTANVNCDSGIAMLRDILKALGED